VVQDLEQSQYIVLQVTAMTNLQSDICTNETLTMYNRK